MMIRFGPPAAGSTIVTLARPVGGCSRAVFSQLAILLIVEAAAQDETSMKICDGQRIAEESHKEIARRNTQSLPTPTHKALARFVSPPLATPGDALGESVNLIVVATGKSEQLSDEFF